MSDFIETTFLSNQDTEFKDAFLVYESRLLIYLRARLEWRRIQPPDMGVGGLQAGVRGIKIFANLKNEISLGSGGMNILSSGATGQKTLSTIAMEATAAERVISIETLATQTGQSIEKITASVEMRIKYLAQINQDIADNVGNIYKSPMFLSEDYLNFAKDKSDQAQVNLKLAVAHLNFEIAKKALIDAITRDVGTNYRIIKMPMARTEAQYLYDQDNQKLILELLPPAFSTDAASVLSATSAVLHSTINPKHIITKGVFVYFRADEAGAPIGQPLRIPVPPISIGKGIDNVDFSKTVENLVPNTKYGFYIQPESKYLDTFLGDIKYFTTPVGNEHTVTFNPGQGADVVETMEPQTASEPTALNECLYHDVSNQTIFFGWNTAIDGSGTTYLQLATYAFDVDIVLYAQWLPAD